MPTSLLIKAYHLPTQDLVALTEEERQALYRGAEPLYDYAPASDDWANIDWKGFQGQFVTLTKLLEGFLDEGTLFLTTEEGAQQGNQALYEKTSDHAKYRSMIREFAHEVCFYQEPDALSTKYSKKSRNPHFFRDMKFALEVIILKLMDKVRAIQASSVIDLDEKITALTLFHETVYEASMCDEGAYAKLLALKEEIRPNTGIKAIVASQLKSVFDVMGARHNQRVLRDFELMVENENIRLQNALVLQAPPATIHAISLHIANIIKVRDEVFLGNQVHTPDFIKQLFQVKGLLDPAMPTLKHDYVPKFELNEDDMLCYLNDPESNALRLTDVDLNETFENEFKRLFTVKAVIDNLAAVISDTISAIYRNGARKDQSTPEKKAEAQAIIYEEVHGFLVELGFEAANEQHHFGFFDTLDPDTYEYYLKSDEAVHYWGQVYAVRGLMREGLITGVEQTLVDEESGSYLFSCEPLQWFGDASGNPVDLSELTAEAKENLRHQITCFGLVSELGWVDRREELKSTHNYLQCYPGGIPHFVFETFQDLLALVAIIEAQDNSDYFVFLRLALQRSPRTAMRKLFFDALIAPETRFIARSLIDRLNQAEPSDDLTDEDYSSELLPTTIYISKDILDLLTDDDGDEFQSCLPSSWVGRAPKKIPADFNTLQDFMTINRSGHHLADLFRLYSPLVTKYLTNIHPLRVKFAFRVIVDVLSELASDHDQHAHYREVLRLTLPWIQANAEGYAGLAAIYDSQVCQDITGKNSFDFVVESLREKPEIYTKEAFYDYLSSQGHAFRSISTKFIGLVSNLLQKDMDHLRMSEIIINGLDNSTSPLDRCLLAYHLDQLSYEELEGLVRLKLQTVNTVHMMDFLLPYAQEHDYYVAMKALRDSMIPAHNREILSNEENDWNKLIIHTFDHIVELFNVTPNNPRILRELNKVMATTSHAESPIDLIHGQLLNSDNHQDALGLLQKLYAANHGRNDNPLFNVQPSNVIFRSLLALNLPANQILARIPLCWRSLVSHPHLRHLIHDFDTLMLACPKEKDLRNMIRNDASVVSLLINGAPPNIRKNLVEMVLDERNLNRGVVVRFDEIPALVRNFDDLFQIDEYIKSKQPRSAENNFQLIKSIIKLKYDNATFWDDSQRRIQPFSLTTFFRDYLSQTPLSISKDHADALMALLFELSPLNTISSVLDILSSPAMQETTYYAQLLSNPVFKNWASVHGFTSSLSAMLEGILNELLWRLVQVMRNDAKLLDGLVAAWGLKGSDTDPLPSQMIQQGDFQERLFRLKLLLFKAFERRGFVKAQLMLTDARLKCAIYKSPLSIGPDPIEWVEYQNGETTQYKRVSTFAERSAYNIQLLKRPGTHFLSYLDLQQLEDIEQLVSPELLALDNWFPQTMVAENPLNLQVIISSALKNPSTRERAHRVISHLKPNTYRLLTQEFLDSVVGSSDQTLIPRNFCSGLPDDFLSLTDYTSITDALVSPSADKIMKLSLLFTVNQRMVVRFLSNIPRVEAMLAYQDAFVAVSLIEDLAVRDQLLNLMADLIGKYLSSLVKLSNFILRVRSRIHDRDVILEYLITNALRQNPRLVDSMRDFMTDPSRPDVSSLLKLVSLVSNEAVRTEWLMAILENFPASWTSDDRFEFISLLRKLHRSAHVEVDRMTAIKRTWNELIVDNQLENTLWIDNFDDLEAIRNYPDFTSYLPEEIYSSDNKSVPEILAQALLSEDSRADATSLLEEIRQENAELVRVVQFRGFITALLAMEDRNAAISIIPRSYRGDLLPADLRRMAPNYATATLYLSMVSPEDLTKCLCLLFPQLCVDVPTVARHRVITEFLALPEANQKDLVPIFARFLTSFAELFQVRGILLHDLVEPLLDALEIHRRDFFTFGNLLTELKKDRTLDTTIMTFSLLKRLCPKPMSTRFVMNCLSDRDLVNNPNAFPNLCLIPSFKKVVRDEITYEQMAKLPGCYLTLESTTISLDNARMVHALFIDGITVGKLLGLSRVGLPDHLFYQALSRVKHISPRFKERIIAKFRLWLMSPDLAEGAQGQMHEYLKKEFPIISLLTGFDFKDAYHREFLMALFIRHFFPDDKRLSEVPIPAFQAIPERTLVVFSDTLNDRYIDWIEGGFYTEEEKIQILRFCTNPLIRSHYKNNDNYLVSETEFIAKYINPVDLPNGFDTPMRAIRLRFIDLIHNYQKSNPEYQTSQLWPAILEQITVLSQNITGRLASYYVRLVYSHLGVYRQLLLPGSPLDIRLGDLIAFNELLPEDCRTKALSLLCDKKLPYFIDMLKGLAPRLYEDIFSAALFAQMHTQVCAQALTPEFQRDFSQFLHDAFPYMIDCHADYGIIRDLITRTVADKSIRVNLLLALLSPPFPVTKNAQELQQGRAILVELITQEGVSLKDALVSIDLDYWPGLLSLFKLMPQGMANFDWLKSPSQATHRKLTTVCLAYKFGVMRGLDRFENKTHLPGFIESLQSYCVNNSLSKEDMPKVKSLFATYFSQIYSKQFAHDEMQQVSEINKALSMMPK